ncbi:unnamed protein product [Dicrocoelium dendriticum]|nr:unnamed protein product [Dicrocoelium dendriticum]
MDCLSLYRLDGNVKSVSVKMAYVLGKLMFTISDGDKIRTKHEMKAILGDGYDLSFFDWRSGKFVSPSAKVRRSEDCTEPSAPKIPRADSPVLPFVRRTSPPNNLAPFVIRSHPDCKRSDAKNIQQEPPHQLFWEKRFTDVCAVDPDTGEAFKPLPLPRGIQTAGVPGYKPAQLVQSIIHALNTREIPIIGQEQPPSAVEKNPCVAVNPVQPMIKTCIVSDDDIRRQEARVKELRRKLELARKKLNPRYSTERHG